MGAYLSSPVTDKISCDQNCPGFTYGASCMQGWRISQEDAHNCLPDFDADKNASLFAVYDGHGGSEVAQYCALHLPDCIKETEQYKNGELGQSLIEAFLKFDATLVDEHVIKELKNLAGEDENEEEEEGDPVGRGEADVLRAEADLPLDELLAKYQTLTGSASAKGLRKREAFQSPMVRAKNDPSSSGDDDCEDGVAPGSSKDSDPEPSGSSTSRSTSSFRERLTNGLADNENNLNKEKELQDSQKPDSECNKDSAGSGSSKDDQPSGSACSGGSKEVLATDSKDSGMDESSSVGPVSSGSGSSRDITDSSGSQSASAPGGSSSGGGAGGSSGQSSGGSSGAGGSGGSDEHPAGRSSCDEAGDEPGPSGSGCSGGSSAGGSGSGSSKAGPGVDHEEDMDGDDSDDDEDDPDEEYEWQEDSEEEEDDEEDEEEVERDGVDGSDEPMMDMSNEEPGADSGCTACVAVLRGDQLVVANAGDSRCVLSRAGKAVDLSFDHKPEDEEERTRIEKAGGRVTADGRVNGGLNLSRAIGDHYYKRKEELPSEEQMITALPDIKDITLEPEDQFFVVACDGIWNYMSSQEVVDYVTEKLKDPERRSRPSLICEELFDHCLAPNTYGDGTGCDNMTCIIVVFNSDRTSSASGDCAPPSKRCAGDLDTSADNTEKRPRVDENDGSDKVNESEKGSGDN